MTSSEWRSLLGYGALTLIVGVWDRKAALWLVGILGVVALMRHPAAVNSIFGGANAAAGGSV